MVAPEVQILRLGQHLRRERARAAQDEAEETCYDGRGSDSLIADCGLCARTFDKEPDLHEEFRVIYGTCEIWEGAMPITYGPKPKRYYTSPQRGDFGYSVSKI